MKRVGKLCLCLAGGLVWTTGQRAEAAPLPNNPYTPIAVRNVFNIHPLPPVDPNRVIAEPPPKITLNGFTSVSGHVRALYTVAFPPKLGVPAKEQSYILSEGEQEDDIEVTKIDERAGTVTFNNHGTEQEIPLASATASSGPAPSPIGVVPRMEPRPAFPRPGFPPAGGAVNSGGFIRFGQSSGSNPNVTMGGNNANGNPGIGSRFGVALAGGGGYSGPPSATQPQNTLSGDDQQALLAYQHAQALSGQNTLPPQIFPPTKFDSDAGVAQPPLPGGPASQ